MEKQSRPFCEYLFDASLTLMMICLGAAFLSAGQWPGALCAAGLGVLWFVTRRREPRWLSHIYLLLSLTLAAASILTHAQPVPAILASGLSLVTWDLNLLMHDLRDSKPKESTRWYEKNHLRSLLLALVIGLGIAISGRMITIRVPFILLVMVILLAVFGLNRLWTALGKSK